MGPEQETPRCMTARNQKRETAGAVGGEECAGAGGTPVHNPQKTAQNRGEKNNPPLKKPSERPCGLT